MNQTTLVMRMYTKVFDQMSELNDFVNDRRISKDQIINIFSSSDGMFYLTWYAE